MEKTDKSAEGIVKESNMLRILQNAEDYAFQVPYDGTKIFCDEKKYKSYLDGAKSELKYAAQQLSEYKEYFELAERAKQVLRDKGYGWTGLDILETCKLVPKAEPPEENQLAPPQESEQP